MKCPDYDREHCSPRLRLIPFDPQTRCADCMTIPRQPLHGKSLTQRMNVDCRELSNITQVRDIHQAVHQAGKSALVLHWRHIRSLVVLLTGKGLDLKVVEPGGQEVKPLKEGADVLKRQSSILVLLILANLSDSSMRVHRTVEGQRAG